MAVLQLLHVACLGTQEHAGWVKTSGADSAVAGVDVDSASALAVVISSSSTSPPSSSSSSSSTSTSSWLCSHEDLSYLDACLRKQPHSHKVPSLNYNSNIISYYFFTSPITSNTVAAITAMCNNTLITPCNPPSRYFRCVDWRWQPRSRRHRARPVKSPVKSPVKFLKTLQARPF